ncbi:MAG: hypothetical protein M0R70_14225 [Nitrospirae bacterium]|nr:hypothetical protein [Nitrospirota bacterium]
MRYKHLIGALLLATSLLLSTTEAIATIWTDHYDESNGYSFAGNGISTITFDDWDYVGPCGQTYKDFQPCNGGFGELGQQQHVVTLRPDRLTPDAPQDILKDMTNSPVYPNANMDGQINFYKWGYTTPGFDIPGDIIAYRAKDYSASTRQGCTFDMKIDVDGDYLVLKEDMLFAYIDTFSYVDATGVNPPQEVKQSISFQPYPVSDAIGWCGSVMAEHPAALAMMGGQITFDFVMDAYSGDPPNRIFMGSQIVPKFEMRAYGTLKVHVWAGSDLQTFSSNAVSNNTYPGNTDHFDPDPNYYNRVSFHGGGVVPDGAWVSSDSYNPDGSPKLNDDGTWNVTVVPEGNGAVWYKNAFAGYAFILRADALRMIDWFNPKYGPEPPCTPVNCDDSNPCTADSCAGGKCLNKEMICPLAYKCNSANGTPACEPFDFCAGVICEDNNLCTTDSCDPAVGCVHKPVACDDGNLCTTESCNPATGACGFTPVICDDVKACATNTCDTATGACKFTQVNCDDGDLCTADSCDSATGGCVHISASCSLVDTTNNNFTMINGVGELTGGTNDVHFTWDGTKKSSVAASGQASNATLESTCPFFGITWMAHDVAIYGPGTYSVYPDCPAGSPGCGSGDPITFTVGAGELGAHMLFNWGVSADIDVVDIWAPMASFGPSPLQTAGCGSNPADKVWDWMSKDWDGDGLNGYGMVDGPFIGFNASFNVMGVPPVPVCPASCDDGNACTEDSCDVATGTCVHTPVAPCCTTAADCNDNNICTKDECAGSMCVYTAIVPAQCNDNNMCTNDGCTNNACTHSATVPASCNDNDSCTTDTCTNNTCGHTAVANCCVTADDCNDNNVCSTDTCVNSKCVHTASCPILTTNNNFTMVSPVGGTIGGTNDVIFSWDGSTKTLVAASGQISNAVISSTCPFQGITWSAHDVAIYGPGTYTVYAGCAAGSPGCGTGAAINFTVGAGQLGAHMLFDWGASKNIDVVNVWTPNAVFAPSALWATACGSNSSTKVWDWMSTDWNNDGKNSYPMVDGPFLNFNGNFNMMGVPFCVTANCDDNNACTADSCDPATGCVHATVADGTTCSSNGQNGVCTAGICEIAPCNGVKSVIIRGGGQKPGTVDLQIQTEFTVVGDGCIVDSTPSTVTVSAGTILQFNCKAGIGPHPTAGTWQGAAFTTDSSHTIVCPAASGDVGKLIIDNKAAGGKDADRMTVTVQ